MSPPDILLCSAIGDALGYKGGDWEFALSTSKIKK